MADTDPERIAPPPRQAQRHRWPWFVLAALILAAVLAYFWMRAEIERTRRIRDANEPLSMLKHGWQTITTSCGRRLEVKSLLSAGPSVP